MTQSRNMYQLPDFLKAAMYVSEVMISSVLFWHFYKEVLCPYSTGIFDITTRYCIMVLCMMLSYVAGVYVRPISFFYRSDRRGSILVNVSLALTIMALVFWVLSHVFGFATYFLSLRIVKYFLLLFVALATWRFLCKLAIRYLRSSGHNAHQVVFVGKEESITELYGEMRHPFYGYHVLGYFSDERMEEEPDGLEYLGAVSDVVPFITTCSDLQQLYCTLPAVRAEEIRRIIDTCERHCVHFYNIPQFRSYMKRKMQLEMLGPVPVLSIREDPLSLLTNRVVKRTFDVVVAGLFMIPFWLVIYPIVALCTHFLQPGPVFFKQKRNGLNGEEFYCYKFRSMKVNADADRMQATKDDPRKTPFGNLLRKTSIDELPQFINVLRGEMSIVGPRPHMVAHTEEYSALIDKYMVRHWVLPGITGWAQVNGARGETRELWQMEDRIQKDVWYVENWSFTLDLKIIFLTVWNVIAGDKQAY